MKNKKRFLFYANIRGKRYRFVKLDRRTKESIYGYCESPKDKKKKIVIQLDNTINSLYAVLHESLHACLWDTDESAITEISRDLSKIIWKLKWRRKIK